MTSPFEDRVAVATPEGVTVELVLAGLGSRFVARLLDSLLQGAAVLAITVLMVGSDGAAVVMAAGYVGLFVVWFGYDVAFEVLASGRTPGKRWTGLRVVQDGGGAVRGAASAVRNLLRLVDVVPGFYLVGAITVVASRRSQRLGDLVAGTLVVRERRGAGDPGTPPGPSVPSVPPEVTAGWDVSGVSAEEVAVVRRFLQRRAALDPQVRARLAGELAVRLDGRVPGAPADLPPERFLEALVAAKDARA